ncbi:hypothetical protein G3A_02610 [Bacillus sp. 17376]|nr:hypothetical protein G3A_02610 [Bacillus sp. 17376]
MPDFTKGRPIVHQIPYPLARFSPKTDPQEKNPTKFPQQLIGFTPQI